MLFRSAPALKWAFARSLEIIGEALQSRPSLVMDEQPQLEWRPIARMRDRLIHHDLGIDDEMVWGVVTSKVSELDRAPRACFEAIDLCRGESTSRSGAHRL